MLRLLVTILFISGIHGDCWKSIVISRERPYLVKNEGESFKPLYSENKASVNSDLMIDEDTARLIKMGYSYPFPMGDTVRLDLFDNEASYAHSFKIYILRNKYLIKYSREIVGTDLVQKFEPVKSMLELNSLDFSNGSKIRGHVEYTGKCVSGCSNKSRRVWIAGNFAVKIHRY